MNSGWFVASSGILAAAAIVTGCASAGAVADRRFTGGIPREAYVDHGRVVVGVLTAMYPALLALEPMPRVVISTNERPINSGLATDVVQQILILRPGKEPRGERRLLDATASWLSPYQLDNISTGGQTDVWDRMQALRDVVEQHPDWTEGRIAEEIVARGGRYDPTRRDTFLALVVPRIRAWPSQLGTVVDVKAQFAFRDPEPVHQPVLTWEVLVTTDRGSYRVSFDPFDGNFLILGYQ
jgi:hypothetical protein